MGVGIGGDYPLSAVITSEFAATRIRGRMMTVRRRFSFPPSFRPFSSPPSFEHRLTAFSP